MAADACLVESIILFGRKAGKEGAMAIKTYRLAGLAVSLFSLIVLFSTTAQARIITVDDDGPADFNNIQAAIDDSTHGDVIVVQPGIYTGDGNRDILFNAKAITVRSIDPNDPNIVASTIIDCNGTEAQPHRGFFFNSGEEADSVLAGLTITNGYSYYGSAICCDASRPTITNCTIVANSAFFGGISCRFCNLKGPSLPTEATNPIPANGAVNVSSAADLTWSAGIFATSHDVYLGKSNPPPFVCNQTSTTFDPGTMTSGTKYYWRVDEINTLGKTIGALWSFTTGGPPMPPLSSVEVEEQSSLEILTDTALKGPTITNCIFIDNLAEEGGGIHTQQSNPVLNNCTFSGNGAIDGGGMFTGRSNSTLVDCTFSGNSAIIIGGGLFCADSNTTLVNCEFSENFSHYGSGVFNRYDSNTTLIDCIFSDNEAIWGGGMYNDGLSCTTLTNCTFISNLADGGGGGFYNNHGSSNLVECKFIGNSSYQGGGMMSFGDINTSLTECIFVENSADIDGGGLYNVNYSNTILTDCIFNNNSAGEFGGRWGSIGGGGGMFHCGGSAALNRCMFGGNSAVRGGGMYNGIYSNTTLTNCLFSGNSAEDQYSGSMIIYPPLYGYGGGIYDKYGGVEVINCSFTENWASGQGGAIWLKYSEPPPTPFPFPMPGEVTLSDTVAEITATMDVNDSNVFFISNCIFWDNQDSNGTGELSQVRIDPNEIPVVLNYSCIQGLTGALGGTGNIDADPCFVQPGFWDSDYCAWFEGHYQLLPESPCVDAGDPNYTTDPNGTDLDGNMRVVGDRIDMGAYEYQGSGQGRLFYVDDDATGANDGLSWDDAFNFLQDALTVARYGDTIFVAQGMYKPDKAAHTLITTGDWRERFWLKNGVAIMGGYAGTGAPDPNARDIGLYETILSGDLDGNDVQVNDPCDLPNEPSRRYNSSNVLISQGTNTTAVLDGFTITAGYVSGMYNNYSSATVKNCMFIDNGGYIYSAAMTNDDCSPTITNCMFFANYCGMQNRRWYLMNRCSPIVTNCTFSGNSGVGGMFNRETAPILVDCVFKANASGTEGGGMHNFWSNPSISKCQFIGNVAYLEGGGIYNTRSNVTLANCLFSGNATSENGGAIQNYRSSSILTNCTLTNNWAGSYGGGIYNIGSDANLTNCILWGDSAEEGIEIYLVKYIDSQGTEYPSTMDVDYSDIGGWDTNIYVNVDCTLNWGGDNIDADPCFVEPGYWDVNGLFLDGDYHLLPDSPCIDSGINSAIPLSVLTDLDGNPRIWDGDNDAVPVVDMGAYEYYEALIVQAKAEIDPHTLNLNSKGRWITAFIWLPEEYDVVDIDPNSILLEAQIKPERFWLTEDNQIAIAKFDREQIQAILAVGDIELTITGQLTDGTSFKASDLIKVIDKGGKK